MMDDAEDESSKRSDDVLPKIRFSPEITAGHILQFLGVLAMAAVFSFGFVNKVNKTADDFETFKHVMLEKFTDVQVTVKEQIAGVNVNIANIPDIRAGLRQVERDIDQLNKRQDTSDTRANAFSDRIGSLQGTQLQQGARLDSVERQRLPPDRHN